MQQAPCVQKKQKRAAAYTQRQIGLMAAKKKKKCEKPKTDPQQAQRYNTVEPHHEKQKEPRARQNAKRVRVKQDKRQIHRSNPGKSPQARDDRQRKKKEQLLSKISQGGNAPNCCRLVGMARDDLEEIKSPPRRSTESRDQPSISKRRTWLRIRSEVRIGPQTESPAESPNAPIASKTVAI